MPDHAPADEGAYLAMPLDDLLRIVAIESHRARTIVIGEDLGTVPPGFRDVMAARGILGMAVLPFERDARGFVPVARWRRDAVAMTGTHDTPTIAGWWQARDLAWRAEIAGTPPTGLEERAADRAALWRAIGEGAPPADPAPVVDAAIAFVAATPGPLVLVPIEDLLGAEEQPNLPGTTTEHPNWRRRLPATTTALFDDPATARRIATLNEGTA